MLWLVASVVTSGGLANEPAEPGYVLLRDRSVLRGTVDEEPGRIIIRYRGSEIRLTRDRVACWADTLDGLYQYQLDRRHVFTVESHVEAALWCLRYGLHERAAAELIAAGRIDPNHPDVERTGRELRVAAERKKDRELAVAEGLATMRGPAADQLSSTVGEESNAGNKDDSDAVDALDEPLRAEQLDGDLMREFTTRVQPLLANRCNGAACHGSGSSNAFQVAYDSLGSGRPTAAETRLNLQSALPWIDPEHPLASPLLVRAVEAHGGAPEPPLEARDRAAVENLRRWVSALSNQSDRFAAGDADASQLAAQDQQPSAASAVDAGQPVRLPGVEDPFDPELFNRRFRMP